VRCVYLATLVSRVLQVYPSPCVSRRPTFSLAQVSLTILRKVEARLGLVTVVIGCLILLTVVGVILKLVLDDIARDDTCPYCLAPLARRMRICPHCHRAIGKR
jgi:hypothetical protein